MKKAFQLIGQIALVLTLVFPISLNAQTITTVAGTGTAGNSGDGGPATAAQIQNPYQVNLDTAGNLYIADYGANTVRKVNTAGIITKLSGDGSASSTGDGGPASAASLNKPIGVAADRTGNIFISEYGSNKIRKIDPSGTISTLTGSFGNPTHLCTDTAGNLYIAAQTSGRVMKVTPAGVVTTYAGNGTGGAAGDGGPATDAAIDAVSGVAADQLGNVYISSWNNGRIRKVNTAGIITTIAGGDIMAFGGDGGPATAAWFHQPYGISADSAGNLYIADNANNRIRYVSAATGIVTTIAGSGTSGYNGDNIPATSAQLSSSSVCVGKKGSYYFNSGTRIRKVTLPVPVVGITSALATGSTLRIYPNPGHGRFTIHVSSERNETANIVITNISGQRVFSGTATTNSTTNISLDQPPGIYWVRAYIGATTLNEKISIK